MSFEYLADPQRPAWSDQLPGRPEPFFLARGEGEHAKLFADTFTVLVSGDETGRSVRHVHRDLPERRHHPDARRMPTPTRRSTSWRAACGSSSSWPTARRSPGC